MLEFIDGAFDEVALFVDAGVEVAVSLRGRAPGNDGLGATVLDGIEDGMGVVALVGQDIAGPLSGDQRQGLGAVVDLAGGQDEA